MRTHFHAELEQLRGLLERLAGDVGSNVHDACEALINTVASAAGQVEHVETRVDFQEVRIEEECLKIIALHQPVADELRYVATVLRINYALERLSDLSEDVVREVGAMSPEAVAAYRAALAAVAARLQAMLGDAMTSFRQSDAGLAKGVWLGNAEYQAQCRAVIDALRAQVTSRRGGEETALALMEAVFNLVRMGAHIADIAKSVLYLILGHVVRHRSREFERSGAGGKTRVLFVCLHNSARSRMAEAWLNALYGDRYEAESAGLTPGVLNPFAAQAMREVGIDLSEKEPRSVEDAIASGRGFDYVITVCDAASAERCPPVLGIAEQMQWEFDDPAVLAGSDEEKLKQVRRIRDAIRLKIEHWVEAVTDRP